MKKVFLFFAFVAILFACSFERGEAQCATGFSETTISFIYGGCTYTIDYCFKCSVTNPIEISINWFEPQNRSCFDLMIANFPDFISKAKEHIIDNQYIICSIPPCIGTARATSYVYSSLCYQIYNTGTSLRLFKCDDIYFCKTEYSTCLDYNYTPPKLVKTKVGTSLQGTPQCDTTAPTSEYIDAIAPYHFSFCWQPFPCN